jgi:ABC-type glycerol-3-phosphate transport system permease component
MAGATVLAAVDGCQQQCFCFTHTAPFLSALIAISCCCRLSRALSQQCTGGNTFFGKTATMLQSAGGIGHLQKILMSIVIALVAISLVLCITMLGYLLGYGKEPFKEALTFVVVVLVVSIPIAIEIVCTTTLALGSRELSGHGAIVTRLASIEEMAGMNMVSSSLRVQQECVTAVYDSSMPVVC